MKTFFLASATAFLFVLCVGVSRAEEGNKRLAVGEAAPYFDATNVTDGKTRCYI